MKVSNTQLITATDNNDNGKVCVESKYISPFIICIFFKKFKNILRKNYGTSLCVTAKVINHLKIGTEMMG